MKKTEKKTDILKVRVTSAERKAIEAQAENSASTVSSIVRKSLFTDKTDPVIAIRTELEKQRLFNLLQHTRMPKDSRELLIKELNKND